MRLRSSQSPAGSPIAPTSAEGRRLIGELMNVDQAAAAAITEQQARTGQLFGETAVEMGVVSESQVRRAIQEQQGVSVLVEGDRRIDPLVVAAFQPEDPLAEAARGVRSLIGSTRLSDGGPIRSVALLGLDADAETPVFAANLAVACAQAGLRTLLIDADLGNPQQHILFRLPNRVGLSTLLAGSERTRLAVQSTAIANLSVATGGPVIPNAAQLIDRNRLALSIEQLGEDFELLLIDAAGIGANGMAEALTLDAAIIVVRRNRSEMQALKQTVERLAAANMPVLGTILVD